MRPEIEAAQECIRGDRATSPLILGLMGFVATDHGLVKLPRSLSDYTRPENTSEVLDEFDDSQSERIVT